MPKLEIVDPWGFDERYTFSPGVRKGNLLFISGLTAFNAKGEIVGEGDIVTQTREIFEKIGKILEKAGATFDDLSLIHI